MIRGDDNDPKITALNHQNWGVVAPLVRPNTIYENDDSKPFCVVEDPAVSCVNPNSNMIVQYQSCPVPGTMRHFCDTGEGCPPFIPPVLAACVACVRMLIQNFNLRFKLSRVRPEPKYARPHRPAGFLLWEYAIVYAGCKVVHRVVSALPNKHSHCNAQSDGHCAGRHLHKRVRDGLRWVGHRYHGSPALRPRDRKYSKHCHWTRQCGGRQRLRVCRDVWIE